MGRYTGTPLISRNYTNNNTVKNDTNYITSINVFGCLLVNIIFLSIISYIYYDWVYNTNIPVKAQSADTNIPQPTEPSVFNFKTISSGLLLLILIIITLCGCIYLISSSITDNIESKNDRLKTAFYLELPIFIIIIIILLIISINA